MKGRFWRSINFWIILVLALLIILPYGAVVTGRQTLLPSANLIQGVFSPGPAWKFCCHRGNEHQYYLDFGAPSWQLEPLTSKVNQLITQGTLPFWNDNSGLGFPLMADLSSAGIFHPLHWFNFLFPGQYGLNLFFLARLFLGALGVYVLFRLLKVQPVIAGLTASLYALSGYFVLLISIDHLITDLLIPWGLVVVELFLLNKHRYRMWAIGLLTIIYFHGNPETLFLILVFAGVYLIYRVLQTNRQMIWQILGWFAGANLLAFMISAVFWIPGLEFLINAGHSHGPADLQGMLVRPISGLATLLFPDQMGIPFSRGYIITYFGLGLWLLTVMALVTNFRRYWIYGLLAILITAKIYDFGYLKYWGLLPMFNQISLSKYLAPFLNLVIVIISGLFINDLFNKKILISLPKLIGSVLLFLISVCIALWLTGQYPDVSGLVSIIYKVASYYWLIAGILIMIFFIQKQKTWAVISLIAIIYLELLIPIYSIDRSDLADPYRQPPYVTWLNNQPGLFRTFSIDGQLFPNTFAAFNIDDIRFLSALWPINYFDYVQTFVYPALKDRLSGVSLIDDLKQQDVDYQIENNQFFDALNVRYVITKSLVDLDPKQYQLMYSAEVQIYQNKHALNRFWSVEKLVNANSTDQVKGHLVNPDFDIKKQAVVLGDKSQTEYSTNTQFSRVIETANEISLVSFSEEASYLVFSKNYYPGWRARIDGHDADIDQVNLTMIGVSVPAGQHKVEVYYSADIYKVGLLVSVLGSIIFLILIYPKKFTAFQRVKIDTSESPKTNE